MTRILAKSPEAEWSVERRVLTTIQTFPNTRPRWMDRLIGHALATMVGASVAFILICIERAVL